MSHNDYTLPYSFWTPTTVPTQGTLAKLDQKLSESLNGQAGGVWTPAEPIVIGGKGLQITGNGMIAGGVQTSTGALPGALVLSENFPQFATPRPLTVTIPIVQNLIEKDFAIPGLEYQVDASGFQTLDDFNQAKLLVPLPMHLIPDQATITGATLTFQVIDRGTLNPPTPQANAFPRWHIRSYARDRSNVQVIASVPPWQALTAYNLGDVVQPIPVYGVGFMCVVAGTSGSLQPAAFATAGPHAIVFEGSLHWQQISLGPNLYAFDYLDLFTSRPPVQTLFAYYNNGLPIKSTMTAPNVNQVIDTVNRAYFLWVDGNQQDLKYSNLAITFTVSDMRPAV